MPHIRPASPPQGHFAKEPTDARQRLIAHFGDSAANDQGERWDSLWKEGDFLPWDRGFPNPALHELLTTRVFSNPHSRVAEDERPMVPSAIVEGGDAANPRRRRALVPGCGKGYDVVLLASAGYDAWGLEVSPHAAEAAKKWAQEVEDSKFARYHTLDEEKGRGSVNFVVGDFFSDGWVRDVGGEFDLIYDYTFLSALPPSRRPAWALRMSQLLSRDPHASLVCVEFPTYKPPSTGGPPYGLPPKVYEQHLSRPGDELKYDQEGHVVEERDESGVVPRNPNGLVRIAHYQPETTHEIGKGTDFISIWRHHSA